MLHKYRDNISILISPHTLQNIKQRTHTQVPKYKSNKRSCCSRYSIFVTRGIICMHRMIASVLRTTLHKAETNDCFFSCRLHHSYFNIASPDASVFLNFSKASPSTSSSKRKQKKISSFSGVCVWSCFCQELEQLKEVRK